MCGSVSVGMRVCVCVCVCVCDALNMQQVWRGAAARVTALWSNDLAASAVTSPPAWECYQMCESNSNVE